ncbi:hypothetical protein [Ammoniphilus sp. CFH 90114]|uniref:hypothetical protein n=1 Tax=Ammoniphilus sp. CFH 90114 TaxID=2493665 RepID=UPI00100DDA77|nr:hypothetical protein [Ammoniphilus sp. CFH 90114]RXT03659.1 hypothetical protein EIZ39_23310 [Ammoniphilus sp. CFH 90114]
MEKITSSTELMDAIDKMNRKNSVCSTFIPGKGRFTIVLQEEDTTSIEFDTNSDTDLKQLISNSRKAYTKGKVLTTTELIKSLTPENFVNEQK